MKKVLIANRGEIAVRIIRSARTAGYATVAVYADQDLDSLHVELADEAVALPGSAASETYLNSEALLQAAKKTGADAVHPGYGFLSEHAGFAQEVRDAGLTWIGPDPETIRKLGNKVTARELAVAAGAPLVPGTEGPVAGGDEVRAFVEEHGLPVAVKAAHGGGGRGMRVIRQLEEVDSGYAAAVREAEAAFGAGECYVERFLDKPRHIEAQVLADTHGNVVVVGTRDCSLQRRNQKLVEEAPAPFLTDEQRRTVHESARAIAVQSGYTGAGTVEYLLSPDGLLTFLEVNTRLQVEHPVTEETTGVDLVAEQLRIAEGQPLSITSDPEPTGHAIEFRINAEDPALGFLPTPGPVETFSPPTGPGVRVDTGVRSGDEVSGAFDSMFAKVIVTAPDRSSALARAELALAEMRIAGLPTVLPFHREVLQAADFRAEGESGVQDAERFGVHTRWIETDFAATLEESAHLASALRHREHSLQRITLEIEGKPVSLGIPAALRTLLGAAAPAQEDTSSAAENDGVVTAGFAGTLVRWESEHGQKVSAGDALAVLEAMKMESTLTAPAAGVFSRAEVEPGEQVTAGQRLGTID
ncbi:acetyl/propionyl/methylcrotonyl-CoA carboxylase subunit alpha [Nesterenkonia natronophila]|uniref:biotin carboxylase n=1 Tax=Nesterenkonia natronophila TaxID=2174932 RepID=A0A3A4FDS2_9MICC|nr:biotin carboxylase N-terminal domain-containing protein [Nesterenkonia natronophila]RJN32944.1 ATP-grasp domain-containing protein [Nesterenkonia natronophila]